MGDIGLIAKDDSCLLPDYLIPDKCLLNTYLLNPIAGKDGIHPWIDLPILDKFSTGRVGAQKHTPSERPRIGANDQKTRYVLGRIRYAPTHTDEG